MPVIAVINRKGGRGKSTLATHLAAYCANHGIPVMLGDVDRQQSAQAWLKLRRAQKLPEQAPIVGWTVDPKNTLRPPAGITRVVLDTPGGLHGFDLARVVMFADAILIPVCNSVFDRDSAAECFAELMTLPRVASGRCRVAAVGMRLDARTRAAEVLRQWADALGLPFVGVLRETQAYVRCVEHGLTLFDMPLPQVQSDMAQWGPILAWLEPVLHAKQPAATRKNVQASPCAAAARPAAPRPPDAQPAAAMPKAAHPAASSPRGDRGLAGLLGWLGLRRLLRRKPTRRYSASALSWSESTTLKVP
ncbi:MAG TPA: ParA family protein [Albitalea sp.]